jgi:ribosomal protein L40E
LNLADRIAQNPEILIGGCITWAFLLVWIMSLLHWTIQGEIDTPFGILGMGLGLGLGILVISPPVGSEYLTPVVAVFVVASVALYVPIRSAVNRHELVAIDMDAIERAYDQLEERPNNVGARFKIAKLVYGRGLHGHAIKLADEALKSMPEDFFAEEHKIVDVWKRQAHDTASFRALPCVECGSSNPPGELYCRKCGAKFLLDQAKGRWIGRAMVRKLMAVWVALLGVFVGIPTSLAALPPEAAIMAISGLAVLVLTTLYAAFFTNPITKRI